jgi:hypothetical protein
MTIFEIIGFPSIVGVFVSICLVMEGVDKKCTIKQIKAGIAYLWVIIAISIPIALLAFRMLPRHP